ncbi:MAG: heparan-alpha-glucosaminide N-acetyltransferase domain-containing protein [Bacteroidota bacterium]|nr:heparan-alpha-glucosaminide N-acetyltransferase domain-containing protein [Bacteroidota bacterium]
MKERLWIPDYLKGWAVLIMIQTHIFETWIRQDVINTPVGEVIRVANNIPAAMWFMLLMGYLAFFTRSSGRKLFFRGIKVFFWGLLLNIGLNFHYLIQTISGKAEGILLESVLAIDILFLAGVSLMILGLIRSSSKAIWISLASGLLIVLLTPWIRELLNLANSDNYIFALLGSDADWSFFPVFPWASYPLIGYAFAGLLKKYNLIQLPKSLKLVIMAISLLLGSVGFIFNWNDLADLSSFYHHDWKVFIWSISFTLGVVILLSYLPGLKKGAFSAWIQFAGKHLTRYYVIQWLIIGNLASFFFKELGLGAYVLGFFVVSAITTIIVFLLKDKHFVL